MSTDKPLPTPPQLRRRRREVWVGLFVGAISIGSQAWALGRGVDYWQTVAWSDFCEPDGESFRCR